VIEGFRLGVIGMRQGETRLIVIPSELAYGSSGVAGIPPNSVLVFRVVLNAVATP
jgi:FKBP-type peptidyl-prolyl cis-trans isomerase